jgi:tRNA (guanine-N7-)-methyltransferase
VVTPELVTALAKFMPTDATVFLQSDVQSVLDEMRLEFRQQPEFFQDQREGLDEYIEENLIGIPTEREVSVLERGLPVYRSIFKRTSKAL